MVVLSGHGEPSKGPPCFVVLGLPVTSEPRVEPGVAPNDPATRQGTAGPAVAVVPAVLVDAAPLPSEANRGGDVLARVGACFEEKDAYGGVLAQPAVDYTATRAGADDDHIETGHGA